MNPEELLKSLLYCFTIIDGHLEFAFVNEMPLNMIIGEESERAILEFINENPDVPIHLG